MKAPDVGPYNLWKVRSGWRAGIKKKLVFGCKLYTIKIYVQFTNFTMTLENIFITRNYENIIQHNMKNL